MALLRSASPELRRLLSASRQWEFSCGLDKWTDPQHRARVEASFWRSRKGWEATQEAYEQFQSFVSGPTWQIPDYPEQGEESALSSPRTPALLSPPLSPVTRPGEGDNGATVPTGDAFLPSPTSSPQEVHDQSRKRKRQEEEEENDEGRDQEQRGENEEADRITKPLLKKRYAPAITLRATRSSSSTLSEFYELDERGKARSRQSSSTKQAIGLEVKTRATSKASQTKSRPLKASQQKRKRRKVN